jgi:uncharacterized repeat protein (TIGR02543 family)
MKSKKFLVLGMLAMTLTFGMVLAGCDIDTGEDTDDGGDETSYTVTYDANGGSSVASQTVSFGTRITLASTSRSGYTFDGWFTSASGGTKVGNAGASYTGTGNITLYAHWTASGDGGGALTEGIYVGLISFDEVTHKLTSEPILLDASGKTTLVSKLDTDYTKATAGGTLLYYGVHEALSIMTGMESRLPANAKSFNIITFTDGIDVGSTSPLLWNQSPLDGQDFGGSTGTEYLTWLNSKLESTRIKSYPIAASAYGVAGDDVSDQAVFNANLAKLKAGTGESSTSITFDQLSQKFGEIASGLDVTTTVSSFDLLITPPTTGNGTTYKMTFDNIGNTPTDADGSTIYFTGEYSYSAGTYTLSNIDYHGINNAETSLTGTVAGNKVKFHFDNFQLTSGAAIQQQQNYIQQWFKGPGVASWQRNSEYDQAGTATSTTTKSTAVIYLVLDSSKSLSSSDVTAIRAAAKNFINVLYNQYNSSGGETSYTVTYDANGGSSVAAKTVSSGTQITLATTSRSGYTFDGWFTSASGGSKVGNASASYTVTGNITLYAHWTATDGDDGKSAPSAPTGVAATALSSSSISVSWNAVTGATSYDVYYEIDSHDKNYAGTVTGTSYTHTGLQANTTYWYCIMAVNSAGESDYSIYAAATTLSSGGGSSASIVEPEFFTVSQESTFVMALLMYPLSQKSTVDTYTYTLYEDGSPVFSYTDAPSEQSDDWGNFYGGVTIDESSYLIFIADLTLTKLPGTYRIKVKITSADGAKSVYTSEETVTVR